MVTTPHLGRTDKEALQKIMELAKPGQQLNIHQAIDLLCDIYNVAKDQMENKYEN